MTEIQIALPKLYPQQQQIVCHPARFKILACGRRFGKTKTAVNLLAKYMLDGKRTAYFAPGYSMAGEVWRDLKRTMQPVARYSNEHDNRLELITGGSLDVWTTNNETVRGRNYHFVVIDEAALIPNANVWQAAIRPLLTDTAGSALFASTPRGRNWFYNLFMHGINPDHADYVSFQFPTSANPYIPAGEIDDAKRHLPSRIFQQEYLAEFLEDGAAVFKGLNRVITAQPAAPEPGRHYVMGIDWGRDNDYTAISIFDSAAQTQVQLARYNAVSYTIQRDRIAQLYERYKPSTILAEANSIGTVNIEQLQNDGLPVRGFYTTNASKRQIIENLILAIEREQIALLNDETLISEMNTYEIQRTNSGLYTYNAASGCHDDTIIATALSLFAIQNNTIIEFA